MLFLSVGLRYLICYILQTIRSDLRKIAQILSNSRCKFLTLSQSMHHSYQRFGTLLQLSIQHQAGISVAPGSDLEKLLKKVAERPKFLILNSSLLSMRRNLSVSSGYLKSEHCHQWLLRKSKTSAGELKLQEVRYTEIRRTHILVDLIALELNLLQQR